MAEVIDIKNQELLEIYTRLPLTDIPKESRAFFVLGNEWSFILDMNENFYEAYLQLKNKNTDFKSFEIDFEVGFKDEEESLGWGTEIIRNERDRNLFWFFDEQDLEVPLDYDRGNILLFKLRFQYKVDPVLNYVSKLADDASQTSPYMDASFLLEGTSKDFHKLFEEDFGHDIQLICGDEVIKAHKVVLRCRSSFFASKFETEGVDTNELKIENMDTAIFHKFFKYFYTGFLPELTSEDAVQLYEAAVEYAVNTLKKLCTSFLIENLSHDNAVNILKTADRYQDREFKQYVMEYMTEKKTSLMGEKWTNFCQENPTLANEVLNLYVQQPRPKKPRLS